MKAFVSAACLSLLSVSFASPLPQPDTSSNDAHQLFARTTCYGENPGPTISDAQACVTQLMNIGTGECIVNASRFVEMCHHGSARVWGKAVGGPSSASSYCRDVAYGLQSIINSCQSNGYVSGTNAAGGNGNVAITLTSMVLD